MGKVSVAFASSGGMGNLIIHANFAKSFREYFSMYDLELVFFGHPYKEINEGIFYGQNWVDRVYTHTASERKLHYNAFINLHYYPQVWVCDDELAKNAPKMYELLMTWNKIVRDNRLNNYLHSNPNYNINALWDAEIKKKSCLNIADITGHLGIGDDFNIEIYNKKNDVNVLHNFGLLNKRFITLQRGSNPFSNVKETPRLWPLEYYNTFIGLLKQEYPDIPLVQVGESKSMSAPMRGIDVDLVGKTDLEDLKVLLKNSWLHIDAECGMVHLRKALRGGPSVVMYGQTAKKVFEYPGNINLGTDACNIPCARLTDDWQWRCARGESKPPCMYSIKPEMVLDAIKKYDSTGITNQNQENLNVQLLADKRFIIDREWAERWLKDKIVLYYNVYDVSLSEILANVYTERYGFSCVPLQYSPVYKQILNNDQSYMQYLNLMQANNINNEHSLQSFNECMERLDLQFDNKYMPIIDGRHNYILDGLHRLSWLLNKYGYSYHINVIKIWWIENRHFIHPDERYIRCKI